MTETDRPAPGRHASWLELFFDLVVVAAIAQLAHRLHGEPTARSVAVFVGLYLAVWIAWTSFTLYANVAGERTRRRALLLGMLGIAVMAAAVPEATGGRALVFAAAYVAVRILGQLSWAGTRQTLLAWPSVQIGLGVLPWLVSLVADAPARYWLWAAGLAVDIVVPVLVADRTPRVPAWVQRMIEDDARRRRSPRRGQVVLPVAKLDLSHLAERLGLFVIIVLGEGVLQLVSAAAGVRWSAAVVAAALAGFALLLGLWWPTFRYGLLPTESGSLPIRAAMPLHFLTVVSITGVAAGLGAVVEHPTGHLQAGVRWLLGGGLAVYFLAAAVGAIVLRRHWHWLVGWGLPGIVLPVVLAAVCGLPGVALVWLLVAVVGWQALYVRWRA